MERAPLSKGGGEIKDVLARVLHLCPRFRKLIQIKLISQPEASRCPTSTLFVLVGR
jgi:hypothetical protein